ncbi:MAG: tripartite tricarboxylate transporter TctB family protein [Betaproteobacteria bacterium]|nr:tripartite tricarboxylate transporter TctB family protein [Betaproteobacteria bacterium]
MLSKDGWAGRAVIAASLFLFALTMGLKESPLVPIGPGFYPRIVLGITAAFGLLLVIADVLGRPRKRPKEGAVPPPNYAAVAIQFTVFGLYTLLLPYAGFRLATFLYIMAASALMEPPRDRGQWIRVVLLGFLTALATWLVFERELSVLLPRGRWTDF